MIDWTRIETLQEEIGQDGFAEVVDLFLAETGEAVARLQAGPDPADLAADLHFLKGGVLNLGFTQVAELCHQGEVLAASGGSTSVGLQEIANAYAQARSLFLAKMSDRLDG